MGGWHKEEGLFHDGLAQLPVLLLLDAGKEG